MRGKVESVCEEFEDGKSSGDRFSKNLRKFLRLMKILGKIYDNAGFRKILRKSSKKNLRPLQSCLRKLRNRLHRSSVYEQKQQQWRSYIRGEKEVTC